MDTVVTTTAPEYTAHSSDEATALVALFRAGHPNAKAQLFDRYGVYVRRLLTSVLGRDDELQDILHEVFLQVFIGLPHLREPSRLKLWITRLAVNIARTCIRRRTRSRWLIFLPSHELPEAVSTTDDEAKQMVNLVYLALGKIRNVDDRMAFTLRQFDGMTVSEVADACDCSRATAKRRIRRGHDAFMALARQEPALLERLEAP